MHVDLAIGSEDIQYVLVHIDSRFHLNGIGVSWKVLRLSGSSKARDGNVRLPMPRKTSKTNSWGVHPRKPTDCAGLPIVGARVAGTAPWMLLWSAVCCQSMVLILNDNLRSKCAVCVDTVQSDADGALQQRCQNCEETSDSKQIRQESPACGQRRRH